MWAASCMRFAINLILFAKWLKLKMTITGWSRNLNWSRSVFGCAPCSGKSRKQRVIYCVQVKRSDDFGFGQQIDVIILLWIGFFAVPASKLSFCSCEPKRLIAWTATYSTPRSICWIRLGWVLFFKRHMKHLLEESPSLSECHKNSSMNHYA